MYFLDITEDVCPITLVRVKVLLDTLADGDEAMVTLNGGEPVENVPRALTELGHQILALDPVEPHTDGTRAFRLHLRKSGC